MTFLETLLADRDLRTARAVNDFKATNPMGLGVDPEFGSSVDSILKNEMEPIATRLHAAVTERVNADSAALADADQFLAELQSSPRRRKAP